MAVIAFDIIDDRIKTAWAISNPEKPPSLGSRLTRAGNAETPQS